MTTVQRKVGIAVAVIAFFLLGLLLVTSFMRHRRGQKPLYVDETVQNLPPLASAHSTEPQNIALGGPVVTQPKRQTQSSYVPLVDPTNPETYPPPPTYHPGSQAVDTPPPAYHN